MRLIDADAMVERYGEHHTEGFDESGQVWSVKSLIDSMPTVDAVPVIRCKDCIFFQRGGYRVGQRMCCRLKDMMGNDIQVGCKEDDFCSHAEMRDEWVKKYYYPGEYFRSLEERREE